MPSITIAVATAPLAPDRHLVVAWFSTIDGTGVEHTRGLAEIWVGPTREGLARIATQALTELKQPSTVELVLRRHDPLAPPPTAETAAALVEAWERHTITFTPVRDAGHHAVLEAAEAFAAARAAGVRSAPSEAVQPKAPPTPPSPRRLF
jgi:pimeloyl-ACP methyl ester carboxylesterase